jgi:alpha-L-arabinofuranosidase
MKTKTLLLSTFLAMGLSAQAQVLVNVDTNPTKTVSPDLYGIFFEDINNAADGGLYAELIRNRSFEDDSKAIPTWTVNGASYQLITKGLLNKAQGHALELTFNGSKLQTLTNDGFWGINAVQGRPYKLSLWVKGKYKGTVKAQLVSADGKTVYAEAPVNGKISGKWQKLTAEMKSAGNDAKAKFQLVFTGKGKIALDVVSLFPPTFKNRPNGLRPDLAEMLYNLHPKFVRFPGGCFVEGQESPANAFHWEKTIGPIEQREGHQNVNWGYRTTDGIGFDEYLQMAEDFGAKPLYVVNVGLWHGGKTPVDSLQPWIDETLNALEYANGDVTTKYGALRAKNGHPAPYNIEYLEIGNENNQPDPALQSDRYYERFKKFKDAILAKYPNMHLIGNVVAWGDDNPKWGSDEPVELLDEHYYRNPSWFTNAFHKYDTYERGKHDIYVGEYAVTQGFGNLGSLEAALGEGVYMMGMENNSDVVKMASYAPIFANLNRRVWAPDMIQFVSDRAFGTPSYYVQKMMFNNIGDKVLNVKVDNPYSYDVAYNLKPEICQVGVGTWATQCSFKDASLTDNGKALTGETVKDINIKGDWTEANGEVSQTSTETATIRLNPVRFNAQNYTYKVRAKKNSGDEGFLIIFNYVDPKNYCWLNIGGWGNTQHGIEQIVNGGKGQMATASGHVETGRWYDVEIDVKGDSVYAKLDGKQIFATRLKPNMTPGFFATATKDSKTGEVIVKLANTNIEGTTAKVSLDGKTLQNAKLIRLTAKNGSEENDIDHPTNVYPTSTNVPVHGDSIELEIPASSLSILRLK